METKRIFRFFSLAEYGEEQKFLEEMHQKGWKLKSYTVFRGYVFEKCIPENWIYQLDYRDEVEDLNAYIQLFQDCGWEYVMMFIIFAEKRMGKKTIRRFSVIVKRGGNIVSLFISEVYFLPCFVQSYFLLS